MQLVNHIYVEFLSRLGTIGAFKRRPSWHTRLDDTTALDAIAPSLRNYHFKKMYWHSTWLSQLLVFFFLLLYMLAEAIPCTWKENNKTLLSKWMDERTNLWVLHVQYRPSKYVCAWMSMPDLEGVNEYKSVKRHSRRVKIICKERKGYPQGRNKETVNFSAFEYLYFFSFCMGHVIS